MKEEIKDMIREHYKGCDWPRLWFAFEEVSHAVVNIPREWLREFNFPESAWVQWLARAIASIPLIILLTMIFNCPT